MITMKTPFPEMHRIFWAEYEKCEYWVNKQLKREGKAYHKEVAEKHIKGYEPGLPDVEYKGESGNRWLNHLYVITAMHRGMAIGYDSVCYWETLGSFGAFMPFQYDGEKYIIITPGHFWQRVCERTGHKMQGVHTAMQFLRTHLASRMELLPPKDGDKRRQVAIHWNGGSGYGVELSSDYNIFEIRTYLADENLSGSKLRERRNSVKELVSDNVKAALIQTATIADMHPDADMAFVMNHVDRDKVNELGESIRVKEDEDMERELTSLMDGGMTEDEAVRDIAQRRSSLTYRDNHGEFQTIDDPILTEVKIRLRESVSKRRRNESWGEMLAAVRQAVGKPLSDSWKKVLSPLYRDGYSCGWVTVHNWVIGDMLDVDGQPLQSFKHGKYLSFKHSVCEWLDKDGTFDEEERDFVILFATAGFDRGMNDAFHIASTTLQLPVDVRNETCMEYLNRHILGK